MSDSISRQFAHWAATVTYEDLPPEVVDKAKALLLFHLVGGVFGAPMSRAQEAVAIVTAEESKADGATIFVDGRKVTRYGAAFANAQMLKCAGLFDSFRMLTHPGPANISVALTNAEVGNNSMKELITALVVGYEFECRIAYDFTPSIPAHGFYSTPIFAIMGSATVAAKLLGLNEDQFVGAIALAASSAAGMHEGQNPYGQERAFTYPNAARQGTQAAVIAKLGKFRASETSMEGNAGFYNCFAGSRDGKLAYSFEGLKQIDLATISAGVGETYKMLEVMFRVYNAPGFNQPIIDLIVEMKNTHQFAAEQVEDLAISINYFETIFPHLEPPKEDLRDDSTKLFWTIQYYAAHAAVNGGFPVVGGRPLGPTGDDLMGDKAVLEFMKKIRVVPVNGHPMFSPEITVKLTDGTTYDGSYPYSRMEWGFDEVVRRLQDCVPGLPGGQERLDALVDATRNVENLSSVTELFTAAGTPQ